MGGGFMFAAAKSASFSAAAAPPFPTARTFPTPAVCAEAQACYFNQNDTLFGPVPSRLEVETAILQLQRFMRGLPTSKPELDGLHGQMMHHDHLNMLQSPGFMKFSQAFAMMQAEPPMQDLVISLSCDAAVWGAILSNKAVNDLQCSVSAGKEEKRVTYSSKEAELAEVILRWIQEFSNSKLFQLLESFASLVHEIFKPSALKEKPTSDLTDLLDEKVRSSLLLSVVILLIVVVTRRHD